MILKYISAGSVKLKHAVNRVAIRPRNVGKEGIASAAMKAAMQNNKMYFCLNTESLFIQRSRTDCCD